MVASCSRDVRQRSEGRTAWSYVRRYSLKRRQRLMEKNSIRPSSPLVRWWMFRRMPKERPTLPEALSAQDRDGTTSSGTAARLFIFVLGGPLLVSLIWVVPTLELPLSMRNIIGIYPLALMFGLIPALGAAVIDELALKWTHVFIRALACGVAGFALTFVILPRDASLSIAAGIAAVICSLLAGYIAARRENVSWPPKAAAIR